MNQNTIFQPGVKYEFNKKQEGVRVSDSKFFVASKRRPDAYSTFVNKTNTNQRRIVKIENAK